MEPTLGQLPKINYKPGKTQRRNRAGILIWDSKRQGTFRGSVRKHLIDGNKK